MKKKYALALSGGGFKGAFQLGALQYMRENWKSLTGQDDFRFDIICGVSVGALNGILTAGRQLDDLETLWRLIQRNGGKEIYHSEYITREGKIQLDFSQLKQDLLPGFKINFGMMAKGGWNSVRRIFDKSVPGMMATILEFAEQDFDKNFPKFKALASNKPLEEKLTKYVDLNKIPEDTIYHCGTVSLNDGLYYSLSNKEFNNNADFIQAILASTAMPVIWAPITEIKQPVIQKVVRNAIDGGIRNNSPLVDVVDRIKADPEDLPYEVIIINCNSGYITPMNEAWNIGDIALRSLTEITLAEIFNDDIREFIKVNALVKQAGKTKLRWNGKILKYFDYKIIQPLKDELGETLDSRNEVIEKRIRLGRQAAQKAFEKPALTHPPLL